MTYKKNVSNMVIAIVCVVLFVVTAFYCVPRFSLLSSNALSATVASADMHGTSGYAVLKVDEPERMEERYSSTIIILGTSHI